MILHEHRQDLLLQDKRPKTTPTLMLKVLRHNVGVFERQKHVRQLAELGEVGFHVFFGQLVCDPGHEDAVLPLVGLRRMAFPPGLGFAFAGGVLAVPAGNGREIIFMAGPRGLLVVDHSSTQANETRYRRAHWLVWTVAFCEETSGKAWGLGGLAVPAGGKDSGYNFEKKYVLA